MKIVTILGTRPEIIRLSLIIKKLDQLADQHVLIHTGQNFTPSLNDVFFQEFQLRKPDYILMRQQFSFGNQIAHLFSELEKILLHEKPDKVLVLGDTNSALSSIVTERLNIPVVHMEAGNRCFDLNVPEEKNRKVIDAISTFNLPYTKYSRENLIREGVPVNRIMVSGNPIYEVLTQFAEQIDNSRILEKLNVSKGKYMLVTAHRAENVDNHVHLKEILTGLNLVAEHFKMPIICSIHPRTKSRILESSTVQMNPFVQFHEPFGFFDFVKLEKHAFCALTDSGTVQEECCLFQVPTVTMRNSTERPETVECGSNCVSGVSATQILASVKVMTNQKKQWSIPEGYGDLDVSDRVVKFILGGNSIV
ncbi:UDP-N-acetylglucosamine 2-epimerase (non-hydrolyzing) [Fictibacillus sp. 5RED26]|uniref:non-hydrolyzing UDP-N-acetylglucosamine 2-epimerase n=1 Tax=Fictibacillus TaxID=1329200 RepID=UPI0018CF21E4|nr:MULTISPECIES: UDP-N-acetylglucosamine 2-epimerase (non-hydrolyzing) [unclassified Fictibacillus]MBH0155667.1 UDP-N-acetylglucosamine 2-epimerase (non-hydrolyzing) [Fictibacillus sp. 5RED26]MBH0172860.1 UDP-N-acetylglucosamine 2-epimerase (non-hydrolyzing) [Fictibacillus sp. 23RED33]